MPRCPKLTLRGKSVLGTDHLGNVGGGGGGGGGGWIELLNHM